MGKYSKSKLQEKYSDWHWQFLEPQTYLSDIDGFWVETRKGRGLVAVYDLKEPNAEITMTEKIVMDWFFGKLPFYIFWVDEDLKDFKVLKYYKDCLEKQEDENGHIYFEPIKEEDVKIMSEWEFVEFLQKL